MIARLALWLVADEIPMDDSFSFLLAAWIWLAN
jgi:hypothetical protein